MSWVLEHPDPREGDWICLPRNSAALVLNCGMYQNDIAELRSEEVDWKAGALSRARSKTRKRGGPVVTYRLWLATAERNRCAVERPVVSVRSLISLLPRFHFASASAIG